MQNYVTCGSKVRFVLESARCKAVQKSYVKHVPTMILNEMRNPIRKQPKLMEPYPILLAN